MQYLDTHSTIKKIVIVIVEASDRLVRKFNHRNITEIYRYFHFFTKGDVTDRAAQDLHCHGQDTKYTLSSRNNFCPKDEILIIQYIHHYSVYGMNIL